MSCSRDGKGVLDRQDLWDKKETKVEMELTVYRADLDRLVIQDHQVKMGHLAYGGHLAFLGYSNYNF